MGQNFASPSGRREWQSAVKPTLTGLSRNLKLLPLGEGSSLARSACAFFPCHVGSGFVAHPCNKVHYILVAR